jgi:hypothetical protein
MNDACSALILNDAGSPRRATRAPAILHDENLSGISPFLFVLAYSPSARTTALAVSDPEKFRCPVIRFLARTFPK